MKTNRPPTSTPRRVTPTKDGKVEVMTRQKLLERLEPTMGEAKALDVLHTNLAVATELYQHFGDGGRQGVYRAMGDLIEYLTCRGIPHAALAPISAVMAAIVDADEGVESQIFRPSRTSKGGSPPTPILQKAFEGKLVLIIECCVRHLKLKGQRKFLDEAAGMAAKMINQSEWGVKVTAAQLKELRERVMQSGKDSPDRAELEISLSSEFSAVQPLEWAKLLIVHQWVIPPAATFRITPSV